ncbi:hypothetical protein [Flavobacterium sp. N2038]|uniref:hypothetical protein n=1 Tax=Flavobacterium sp. N2038 TaxID=2986829 RepID=UPI00222535F1|nr:hypothetical protein [Flavobacterium sp. N2038]
MKKIGLLILSFLLFVSCSNDTKDDSKEIVPFAPSDYYGKWVQFVDSKFANDPSSKQFSYVFNNDKTFVKTRSYDNKITTLSGTFGIVTNNNVTQFILSYKEYNMIISNCSSDLKESFTLDKLNHLNDNASACDRSYIFKKEE